MQHIKIKLHVDVIIAVLIALLCYFSTLDYVTDLPPNDDGTDNLGLAVGLAHYGTMGKIYFTVGKETFKVSNSREPVPNWLTAQWIKLNPVLFKDKQLHIQQTSKQLKLLKWPNVLMFLLTILGTYFLTRQLLFPHFSYTTTVLVSLFSAGLTYACMHPVFISTLLTEFHGAVLAVWFTWAWLRSWQQQSWRYAALAGILLGLLVLTKAAFLYISLILLVLVILLHLLWKKPIKELILQSVVLVCMLLVVLPWMWRNYIHFGAWEIAGRGPNVLMTRAYKSQMTHEEFKGAFYAYAPASLKKTMKELTGFNGKDREKGGRLQRFTRFFESDEACRSKGDEACAIGYYIKANIRYNNIMADFAKIYADNPTKARVEGDKKAKKVALDIIKANPWGHIKTSLVFAWRGAWPCNKVDGRWFKHEQKFLQSAWQEITPFIGLCSMFLLAIFGSFKQKVEWVILSWLGTSTFCFYATASHFIPRYSEMMLPIWLVCLIFSTSILLKFLATPKTTV